MSAASYFPTESLALAVGLGSIALFLGLWQWYERNARETELTPADARHFSRQDIRRRLGMGLLIAISIMVLAGSRVSPSVEGKPSIVFIILGLVVLALLALLLFLALVDWRETRNYGRRHRREMIRESISAIHRHAQGAAAVRQLQDVDR